MRSTQRIRFARLCVWLGAVALIAGCASTRTVSDDRPPMTRERMYAILHETYVRVDYEQAPLAAILEEMEEISGLDILPLWRGRYDEGLHPDAVLTLQFDRPIRLVDAIELVLDQSVQPGVETTWQLGHTWVEVGTYDSLNPRQYTVVYPFEDLLTYSPVFAGMPEVDRRRFSDWFNKGRAGDSSAMRTDLGERPVHWEQFNEAVVAEEIMELLTSVVDIFQWERNGGEGGKMRYFNGVFIVTAADYLHRQLGGYHFIGSESLFARTSPPADGETPSDSN